MTEKKSPLKYVLIIAAAIIALLAAVLLLLHHFGRGSDNPPATTGNNGTQISETSESETDLSETKELTSAEPTPTADTAEENSTAKPVKKAADSVSPSAVPKDTAATESRTPEEICTVTTPAESTAAETVENTENVSAENVTVTSAENSTKISPESTTKVHAESTTKVPAESTTKNPAESTATTEAESTAVPVSEDIREIVIPGCISISAPAGAAEINPELCNPADNTDAYDMMFTLQLKESGKTVFSTDYVKAGDSCGNVALRNLPKQKGSYAAVLIVQPKRLSDSALTNNARIELTLVVE